MDINLQTLDERILAKMRDYAHGTLAAAAEAELERRTLPRFDGPILVRLGSGYYAFKSDLQVAIGDTVTVETTYGPQEGMVYAYGTGGSWDPRKHGPLKRVLRVVR